MKRSCKDIDMRDWRTLYPWVEACVWKHRRKRRFARLATSVGGVSNDDYIKALNSCDKTLLKPAIERIAKHAVSIISSRKLNEPKVSMRERVDKSSGKVRLIGCQSAMQQVLDAIAVASCDAVWARRIVPQQASSIPGRGQVYGMQMIRKWVQHDLRAYRWACAHGARYHRACAYWVILDTTKCYQSMRLDIFLELFVRDVANDDIIWLWWALLDSHRVDGYEGFMIGSLVSQYAAQYVMSFAYRHITTLHKTRRGKRKRLVSHCLMYMDDILLTSPSRRDLLIASREVVRWFAQRGLTIKPNWQICRHDKTPIDMMGYRIHASGKVSIRPRVFVRVRRMAMRCRGQCTLALSQAKRICSYKGWVVHSDSGLICRRYKYHQVSKRAARKVSRYERTKHEGNLLHAA
ncbi:reverse transcriptase domain-containing protein [Adlercreutzia sp. ZJ141]|uniref:reverse transcriptase domain-containing protein n=1 Tax=Adlercreutzia sp. ZJ141 TaxID=2709406 RepID=UPI0013EC2EB0|nr:reverse transcriptase domain-containing protein [Adlercreutzia sp. ZJ141]